MEKKIQLPQRLGHFLSTAMLFPLTSYAHLISITATQPFPATIAATANAIAIFKVTNITSRAHVTVVDQSNFPVESGLSISSSTCGSLLGPKQSCTIKLSLVAPSTSQTIMTALREWAKPTVDGVQYPIVIQVTPAPNLPSITLSPVTNTFGPTLPALRDPVVGQSGGNWLIVSGSLGNFHDFNNSFNTDIYVFNPNTHQIYSVPITSTDLDIEVVKQLASSSTQHIQDGDTLYNIGGYYTADNHTWTTLHTITAINVPQMMSAVIAGQTNLNQYVNFRTDIPQFKVTGGQIGKINDHFYLAYGQSCADGGSYCTGQVYTNSIYQFITDPTLTTTAIVNTVSHPDHDGSGWRRRDYSLIPYMQGATEMLLAMAGPFTPGNNALVWTNGISIGGALTYNDSFIANQQGNQYDAPFLSMYSANRNVSYIATFSGLSNLYWSTSGLQYNNTTPYGNVLDLITANATGTIQEYVNFQPLCSEQPLANCLYMGLTALFIPANNYYDSRGILQLDQLPTNTSTLVGYLYGGLLSPDQIIFSLPPPPPPNPPSPSYVTNQIYAIYVKPAEPGAINWKNITSFFPSSG